MISKSGSLTVYFTEDEIYLLEELAKIREEKGIPSNKVIIAALKTHLDVMKSMQKAPAKKAKGG